MASFRETADKVFAKRYWDVKPSDYFRVSGLGMLWDCYWTRKGEKPDNVDDYTLGRKQMVPEVGTYMHHLLQDVAREAEKQELLKIVEIEKEVKSDELHVMGHIDMILEIDGRTILYDIKTINSQAYSRMKDAGSGSIVPYPHHVKQVLAYDWLMGSTVDEIRIFYVARDDGRREEIPVERNSDTLKEIMEDIKTLNDCWEKGVPPEPPSLDSWNYKYSNFKHLIPNNQLTMEETNGEEGI